MSPPRQISHLLGTLLLVVAAPCIAQTRCEAPRNPVFAKYEKLDITDGWFEVYRLPGGVYALFEPRQAEQVFSYLIVGEKRALLFDSGFGIGHIDAVVKRLTPLPVIVLNSRTHYEHVGGNFAFSEIFGVDSDYTRKSAHGKPNSLMADLVSPKLTCPPLPSDVPPENFSIRPFPVTSTGIDGHRIGLCRTHVEVKL